MKKIALTSFISAIVASAAGAATIDWWLQPTICRRDPTNCYVSMGAGYEPEMWDATSDCWGVKLICPEALTITEAEPYPMGRAEIERGKNINTDFDTNRLNNDCFGVRKTSNGGAMASVDNKYVNVWCNGILDNPDEILTNGEIVYGAQPTCRQLAKNGYIGVLNNRCYGKYLDTGTYNIECGDNLLPDRLVIVNGSDYPVTHSTAPIDQDAADDLFDTMESNAASNRKNFFVN